MKPHCCDRYPRHLAPGFGVLIRGRLEFGPKPLYLFGILDLAHVPERDNHVLDGDLHVIRQGGAACVLSDQLASAF